MERALRCVQFQFSGFHISADSIGPAFCAFPGPSSSGCQELDGRLTGALSLSAVHLLRTTVPASVSTRASQVRVPCVCSLEGAGLWLRPSRRMSTIQNQEVFG